MALIEFAPLNVPWERRMQTFAALFWICTFFFMGLVAALILAFIFFYTKYYYLTVLYLLWLWYDKDICERGGRRVQWVRKWALWKHYCNYFPIRLIKLANLDPTKNYLFACHPHGILCSGAFGNFATEGTNFSEVFPGLKPHLLTLQGHYIIPGYRDFLLCSGSVAASKDSLKYLLTNPEGGHVAAVIVGGASESFFCHPGTYQLVLKKRKGFIRIAMQTGASIVPVFSFGETDVYDQISNPEGSILRTIQEKMRKVIGLAPVLFLGRGIFQYSFGILPFRKPIYTVVGEPIHIDQNPHPTQEEVDKVHNEYVQALIRLFETQKAKYLKDPNVKLTIS
ncbi:2-acylglycerol O-acyltransferase 2-A-like isoform X2 [Ischnura elegans]|nr:2-acylglycerol O-acyltransferase 2-A-like isoform X2 [Ischnura elegans]